ncbi:Ankyrin_repeat-containing protein [Hexamita inflata]|uniref:Ankyrin repeat-containing protein n=1 Tax=Hexamita inflata TaxID=28002 RepID=A0AA86QP53_9EUKA|nr:Ankyrin repeat-containing protein [Hexamita inflata]
MQKLSDAAWLQACATNDVIIVSQYKHQKAKYVDNEGNSGLILATQLSHNAIIKILAQMENCIQNNIGYTALMYAVINNNVQATKWLCPYEMGLRNDNGDLALHLSKNPIITDILSIEKNYDNQEIGRFVKDITNLIENIHKSDYAMKQWNMETNRYSWADLEIVLENFYKVTQKFAKKYQQEEIQKG